MARSDDQSLLVPSVWDRLADEETDISKDTAHRNYQTVSELKKSVIEDLEALLNTRQEAFDDIPPGNNELQNSLWTYGLPDLSIYNPHNQRDRIHIKRTLERTIKNFEPRLRSFQITILDLDDYEQTLKFRIKAVLRLHPAPQSVVFDGTLQLAIQKYKLIEGKEKSEDA